MEQSQTCCVCLKSSSALTHIWDADCNNTKWIQKLSSCVPEVLWCEEYLICNKCIEQLEIASAFRKLCLQSYVEHQQQWEKSVEESIKSEDFNVDVNAVLGIVHEVKEATYEIPKNKNQKASKRPHSEVFPKVSDTLNNLKEERGCISLLRHLLQTKQETESKPSTSQKINVKSNVTEVIVIDDEKNDVNFTHMGTIQDDKNPNLSKEPIQHIPDVQTNYCITCKKTLRDRLRLAKHNRNIHNLEHPWSCMYCDKNFKTHKQVQSHEDIHQTKHKCKICLLSFNSRASVISHISYKHVSSNELQYKCPHCNLSYPKRDMLKQHILTSHTHPGGDFVCFHCGEGFSFKPSLIAHLGSEHNLNTKTFYPQNQLDEHLRKDHQVNVPKRKKYRCTKCSRMYTSLAARNSHLDNCDADTGFYISKKKLKRGPDQPEGDQEKEMLVGWMVS